MAMPRLVALALLVGCSSAVAPPVPDAGSGTGGSGPTFYAEGTRLRIRILTASDGTVFPYAGLVDTQLNTMCAFVQTSAGWRCVPQDQGFDAGTLQLTDYVSATVSP